MKQLIHLLLFCLCVSRFCITVRGAGDLPVLPGWQTSIEKAVRTKVCNFIAVARFVHFGPLDPPRIGNLDVYPKAQFEVTKVIRGKAIARMEEFRLVIEGDHPTGPGGVEEGTKYIIFGIFSEEEGSVIGKLLLDNEKTEKAVAKAIAIFNAEPKTPPPTPGPPLPGLIPIPTQPRIESK